MQTTVALALTASLLAPGGTWRPVRPGLDGGLMSVTAPAPGVAWAVGTSGDRPLLLAWRKNSWQRAKLAGLPDGAVLTGVSASGKADAWAVGAAGYGRPISLHHTGRGWTSVPFPQGAPAFPQAVDARSPRNAWAVGSTSGFAGSQAATWHWNGTAWTPFAVPDAGLGTGLTAIDGPVTVGSRARTPLIYRWANGAWAEDEVSPINGEAVLTDVSGDWAVGGVFEQGTERPLVLRYSSGAWKRVAAPGAEPLTSVESAKSGTWIAGGDLVARWSGPGWAVAKLPSIKAGPAKAEALAAIGGSSSFWAVGTAGPKALTWTNSPRPR